MSMLMAIIVPISQTHNHFDTLIESRYSKSNFISD
jgi:hypothetical protein